MKRPGARSKTQFRRPIGWDASLIITLACCFIFAWSGWGSVAEGSATGTVLGSPSAVSSVLPGQAVTIQTATPTFSPVAGYYATAQSVTISDATSGATIYYTTDGTTPTTSSTPYTGPISISSTETLKAIAVASGFTNSAVGTATYGIAAAEPVFSPPQGKYTTAQSVAMSDTTPGATIYYTTDGSNPGRSSAVYVRPIAVSSTEVIKAIAMATGYNTSPENAGIYTIIPVLPTPTFSPVAGYYATAQSVTISDATTGATIYYTTNGTTPTTSSTKYTGAIPVSSTETLKAIAVASGFTNSSVVTATYGITAAQPMFSPPQGKYTTAQSVAMSDTTTGATIYYTTDGSNPGRYSAVYVSPIAVSSTEVIKAIAMATGYYTSPENAGIYTIAPVLPTPTFSAAAGSYASAQTVTIMDTMAGVTIYFTTNGITPTTSSAIYTSPINVTSTETLKAMAAATGYTNSAVVTAAYTINGVYQVDLSWYAPTGSTDLVAGYNIYRTTGSGSSYQLLNSSIDTQTTYLDSTVQSGTAYTYYVESVDASGTQSVPSSPTSATIP